MKNSTKCWQWIAILVASSTASTAWGQLPAQKKSPLNQLGRSWGFGISDGYHECPECVKPGRLSQMSSWFDKVDPLKSTLYGESYGPSHATGVLPPGSSKTSVLPPSPQMYEQFAAPIETPLPGSTNSAPWSPPVPPTYSPSQPEVRNEPTPSPFPDPNASLPSNVPNHSTFDSQPSPTPASPIPDPIRAEADRSEDLLDANTQETSPFLVPPAPPLRSRQPDDRPLGEMPENWTPSPIAPPPAARPAESDEDLNLLPDSPELPPITYNRSIPTYPASVASNPPPQQLQRDPVNGSRSLLEREYSYPTHRSTVQNPYVPANISQQHLSRPNRYR